MLTHLAVRSADLEPGDEWHDTSNGWKVVLVQAGYGYWMSGPGARELGPGDVLVIAPSTQGLVRGSRISRVRLRYLCFWPEHFVTFMSLSERMSLEAAAKTAETRVIPQADPIATEFAAIAAPEMTASGFVYRCRILHLVALLFGDAFKPAAGAEKKHAGAASRFHETISSLTDADLLECTSEKLAAMCGCSVRQFRRLFREHFKTSVRAKQTELRLERAHEQLRDSNHKIVTIAAQNGYRHIGLFNSMFRKRFGVAPGEWRRLNAPAGGVAAGASL